MEHGGEVVAFVALIVSIMALGITVWQASLTRLHNRISVKPALCLEISNRYDPITKTFDMVFKLENCGGGPAFVTGYEVSHGETYFSGKSGKVLDDVYGYVCDRYSGGTFGIASFQPGNSVLKAGDSIKWMSFKMEKCGADKVDDMVSWFQAFRLEITYRSLYGEVDSYSNDPEDWG